MTIKEQVAACRLVPVVVMDRAADAADTAKAMAAGGVNVMEITMRTDAGLDSIAAVAEQCPDVLVGAGTVTTMAQCKESIRRGAKFIVSPGYDPEIVNYCLEQGISVYPGCVTPTEINTAIKAGLSVIKFFPANVYGGIGAIKALAGPFSGIQFIPTGGVSETNLKEYLIPEVLAVGGGWLCPRKDIAERRFEKITEICARSSEIVRNAR